MLSPQPLPLDSCTYPSRLISDISWLLFCFFQLNIIWSSLLLFFIGAHLFCFIIVVFSPILPLQLQSLPLDFKFSWAENLWLHVNLSLSPQCLAYTMNVQKMCQITLLLNISTGCCSLVFLYQRAHAQETHWGSIPHWEPSFHNPF